MRTLLILTALVVLATGMFGCSTASHSVGQNLRYTCDDSVRAFGLDQPSALHPRDNMTYDSAEPYRGYP